MAHRGALQTPFDDAAANPGLSRGGSGTSGGVDVDPAGAQVVQTPFVDAVDTPGNRETPNSMSGTPAQNTFEAPDGFGQPGTETDPPFTDLDNQQGGRTIR